MAGHERAMLQAAGSAPAVRFKIDYGAVLNEPDSCAFDGAGAEPREPSGLAGRRIGAQPTARRRVILK